MATWSNFRGKDLDKDPEFQALIADPEAKKYVYGETLTLLGKKLPAKQWTAMWIFLAVVAVVAMLGAVAEFRPIVGKKPLSMTLVIQMFMFACGAIIVFATGTAPEVHRRYSCLPFRYGCRGLRVRCCMDVRYSI